MAISRDRIDNQKVFGYDSFPLRMSGRGGAFRWLIEAIGKFFILPMLPGGFLLGVSMFILVAIDEQLLQKVFPWLASAIWASMLMLGRSWRAVSFYDIESGRFIYEHWIGKRRTSSRQWPKKLFRGITFGPSGIHGGGTSSVVRLEGKGPGKQVDGFFVVHTEQDAERDANRLSELTGLENLGRRSTGRQHQMDDMRHDGSGTRGLQK